MTKFHDKIFMHNFGLSMFENDASLHIEYDSLFCPYWNHITKLHWHSWCIPQKDLVFIFQFSQQKPLSSVWDNKHKRTLEVKLTIKVSDLILYYMKLMAMSSSFHRSSILLTKNTKQSDVVSKYFANLYKEARNAKYKANYMHAKYTNIHVLMYLPVSMVAIKRIWLE